MEDKNTYLMWPHESGPQKLILMKPLWISSDDIIHSCRIQFGIVGNKLKLLMRTFLTQNWTEDMNKDAMKYVYIIDENLVLTDFVKASLLLNGFKKLDELQGFLTPALFAHDETTVFVDEDKFNQFRDEHYYGWTKKYQAEGVDYDDFFCYLDE